MIDEPSAIRSVRRGGWVCVNGEIVRRSGIEANFNFLYSYKIVLWCAGSIAITIEDTIPVPQPDVDLALLVVRIGFTEGDDHRYAIPIMRATGRLAMSAQADTPGAVIAHLDDGDVLVDVSTTLNLT